jgi:hypothetical protein
MQPTSPAFSLVTNPANCGFVMRFNNGYVVSVRWGYASYAERLPSESFDTDRNAMTAEVGVWYEDGNLMKDWHHVDGFEYNGDDVLPHCDADNVCEILWKVGNLPVRSANNV